MFAFHTALSDSLKIYAVTWDFKKRWRGREYAIHCSYFGGKRHSGGVACLVPCTTTDFVQGALELPGGAYYWRENSSSPSLSSVGTAGAKLVLPDGAPLPHRARVNEPPRT